MGKWGRRFFGSLMMIYGAIQLAIAVSIPFLRYAKPISTWTLVEVSAIVGLFAAAFLLGGYAIFARLRPKP